MSLTRSYVEKLIYVRDAYKRERGPNDDMDKLVEQNLIKLLMDSNRVADVPTMRWCHRQLERERLLEAERLVPSGILDAHDDFYDPQTVRMPRRPSANPSLSALSVYDWNPSPHIGLHPYSYNLPHASDLSDLHHASANPFRGDASAFVPNPHAHRRPDRQSRKGGKNRTNKHKKGKKGKKGKKSIRRGNH